MLDLYRPELEDLWFREAMMNDPDTMSYNHAWGGTIPFPKETWEAWRRKWIEAEGNERYYRYLLHRKTKEFVGEAAYHLDRSKNIYMADVVIYAKYRGKGYGGKGLELLCGAAKDNGLSALYDDIAVDNPSVHMFLRHGFTVDYQTDGFVTVKRVLSF